MKYTYVPPSCTDTSGAPLMPPVGSAAPSAPVTSCTSIVARSTTANADAKPSAAPKAPPTNSVSPQTVGAHALEAKPSGTLRSSESAPSAERPSTCSTPSFDTTYTCVPSADAAQSAFTTASNRTLDTTSPVSISNDCTVPALVDMTANPPANAAPLQ